jgi:hypothetical protein
MTGPAIPEMIVVTHATCPKAQIKTIVAPAVTKVRLVYPSRYTDAQHRSIALNPPPLYLVGTPPHLSHPVDYSFFILLAFVIGVILGNIRGYFRAKSEAEQPRDELGRFRSTRTISKTQP